MVRFSCDPLYLKVVAGGDWRDFGPNEKLVVVGLTFVGDGSECPALPCLHSAFSGAALLQDTAGLFL